MNFGIIGCCPDNGPHAEEIASLAEGVIRHLVEAGHEVHMGLIQREYTAQSACRRAGVQPFSGIHMDKYQGVLVLLEEGAYAASIPGLAALRIAVCTDKHRCAMVAVNFGPKGGRLPLVIHTLNMLNEMEGLCALFHPEDGVAKVVDELIQRAELAAK